MSTDLACLPENPAPTAPPWTRWAGLTALLIGEILGLTLRFDTLPFWTQTGWWAQPIRYSSHLLRLGIAVVSAILLVAGPRLWEAWQVRPPGANPGGRRRHVFLAHLTAFAAFAQVTAVILEGDLPPGLQQGLWVLAWLISGAATLVFLALTAMPATLWGHLVRSTWPRLLVGGGAGLAAWAAGLAMTRFWEPLGRATLAIVHALLNLAYADVVCRPEEFEVGTSTFWVRIAPHCSGYEGIGLMVVFLAVYLGLFRRHLRFPRALLLLPLGTAVIWLANAVRIAALVAIGTSWSPEVALGGFHSQAGWLAFNAVALGLVALSRSWRFLNDQAAPRLAAGATPAAPYLVPFLTVLAAAMVTTALAGEGSGLYGVRVLAAAGVLWYFRRAYIGRLGPCSWQAVACGAGAFLFWLALSPPSPGNAPTAGPDLLPPALAALGPAWRLLGYLVIVPLVEELAFRGYLIRRLQAGDFQAVPVGRLTWFSFLVSSALFGVLHGRCWLPGTVAGMLFALAVARRGRLVDGVAAHATTNGLLAVYALAAGDWLVLS